LNIGKKRGNGDNRDETKLAVDEWTVIKESRISWTVREIGDGKACTRS
jgi:hypothetical protein